MPAAKLTKSGVCENGRRWQMIQAASWLQPIQLSSRAWGNITDPGLPHEKSPAAGPSLPRKAAKSRMLVITD
jgi:hypothetical protein